MMKNFSRLECNFELQSKENEMNSFKISFNLKNVQFNRRNVAWSRRGWKALGNLIKDCSEKFDLKEKQLRGKCERACIEDGTSIFNSRID